MRVMLACQNCKKRKIKCDRNLPECTFCRERGQTCQFPTEAQKPGPKPGMVRKHRQSLASSDRGDEDYFGRIKPRDGESHLQGLYESDPLSRLAAASEAMSNADRSSFQTQSLQNASSGNAMSTETTSPVNSFTGNTPESNMLSRILHPSHDTRPPSEEVSSGPADQGSSQDYQQQVGATCNAFQITGEAYEELLDAYFDHMTSFSLFRRPQFVAKLSAMPIKHIQALLAAMFSFSTRFVTRPANSDTLPGQLQKLAVRLIEEIITDCNEDPPPLSLLQTMILVTFQQLINGVRGRAWRSLGNCIRIAYELGLHRIDLESLEGGEKGSVDATEWCLQEEKRRAWWAIWELDVFASTIRCLPTGVDWSSNLTYLPVDDAHWYESSPSPSCELAEDPSLRWKRLQQSGNKSAKAWFIVANSLMRSAQSLSLSQRTPVAGQNTSQSCPPSTDSERLVLENSISCLAMALPSELIFQNNYLPFKGGISRIGLALCSEDSSRYSVHMMIQLARLMIHRHQVFWHAHRILRSNEKENEKPAASPVAKRRRQSSTTASTTSEQRAWNHYLDAANNIVNLVRSSSHAHVKHVNPCLANTIWLAAAAQVLCTVFGPEQSDRRVAESNLDLLRSTFRLFGHFWDLDQCLQDKLDNLETQLQSLKSRDSAALSRHSERRDDGRKGNTVEQAGGGTIPGSIDATFEAIVGDGTLNDLGPMDFPSMDVFSGENFSFNPFGLDLDELFAYGP